MKRVVLILTVFLTLLIGVTARATVETAESVYLMNAVTGESIVEKNADVKKSMASTTKIMTLIAALENAELGEVITVCREATLEEGSSAYLKAGAKITMEDALYGLMLNSGNDAAVAIAYHISGSVEEFAALMNDTAKKIGAYDTHFVNPNGIEAEGHYTTARDLAKITQYGLENETFRKITSTKSHTAEMTTSDGNVERIEYINHNRLLRELDGCIGVKTGFTKKAGRCLVSAVERGNACYIAVTLNDSDDWNTHKALHKKAFDEQRERVIVKADECVKHLVSGKSQCELVAAEGYSLCVSGEENHDIEVVTHIPDNIDFPVNRGEKVGYLEVCCKSRTIAKVDVIADNDFMPNTQTRVKNCYKFTLVTLLRNIL